MLYQFYEAQRAMMEPFAEFALASSKMLANPSTPAAQNPMVHRVSAYYDLIYRLGKDYVKPEFGIHSVKINGSDVAVQECVEIDKPFCELRQFKCFSDNAATLDTVKQLPSVLIVAPLSGHYATLLRDTVRTMMKDHKVFITDWKNARLEALTPPISSTINSPWSLMNTSRSTQPCGVSCCSLEPKMLSGPCATAHKST